MAFAQNKNFLFDKSGYRNWIVTENMKYCLGMNFPLAPGDWRGRKHALQGWENVFR